MYTLGDKPLKKVGIMDCIWLGFLLLASGCVFPCAAAQENKISKEYELIPAPEYPLRWKCDNFTKYPHCTDEKSRHLCYIDDNGIYVPCYQKCHNVKDRPFDIIDCERFCKDYFKKYCTNITSSTTQPPVSLGTTRKVHPVTAWNKTLMTGSSVFSTNTTSKYYLFFLVLIGVVPSIIIGVLVKKYKASRRHSNAVVGSDPPHVTGSTSSLDAQELVEVRTQLIPEDEDIERLDKDFPSQTESEFYKPC